MTPIEASKPENEAKIFIKFYGKTSSKNKTKPRFNVGDSIRISKDKTVFKKRSWLNWTEETFVISEIQKTIPITYKINDLQNEEVEG